MQLSSYLDKKKLTPKDMARELNLAKFSVERYLAGRLPSAKVMREIYAWSQHRVTPNDFFGIK
jgi:hypothetical protein